MREYRQLSYDERVKMAMLWQSQSSITEIAGVLERSKSTICRELKRNQAPPEEYWPDTAQNLMLERRHRDNRIDSCEALKDFVITKLCCHYWTPEQIAGWLKHRQTELPSVSHETIYTWLYKKPQKKDELFKFLPRHKAKRGLRKSKGIGQSGIPNRASIHECPNIGKKRKKFGHFEGDLMSFQKNSQHIVVLRERKTMMTFSAPLPSKRTETTTSQIIELLANVPAKARKTLTFNNGGEFAGHETISKALGIKTFFCDPYASWEKGGVENTNGRLRPDLPRKTNIRTMKSGGFR